MCLSSLHILESRQISCLVVLIPPSGWVSCLVVLMPTIWVACLVVLMPTIRMGVLPSS